MAKFTIKRVAKGDLIRAEHIDALWDAIESLNFTVAAPLTITGSKAGPRVVSLGYGYDLWCVFELTADLNRGGNATAQILWDQNQAGTWSINGDTAAITVYDAVGTFQGVTGDRGLAAYDRQSGLWVVWNLFC